MGHLKALRFAKTLADRVIVLIGSSNSSRSSRNPFTYEERASMINQSLHQYVLDLNWLTLCPINDHLYNDDEWVAKIQAKVAEMVTPGEKVGIIGHDKDSTSYYLKLFPGYERVTIDVSGGVISSTDIRDAYFQKLPQVPDRHFLPQPVISFMHDFYSTKEYAWLYEESKFNREYKAIWAGTPYPVIIACVDALVVQSGHILLVERKNHPGKGLLALPGGHVNIDEKFRDAAIRELKEETRISDSKGEIPPAMLASFIEDSATKLFDSPHRSERGRVITQAYTFKLPASNKLYAVRGDDDAEHARWYELGKLDPRMFFEDHWQIIHDRLGV
jgi:bifunctional NMN adenylyltransferase/nudix hydrolase